MRFLTAGESHGPKLTAIIEGIPAGLSISAIEIDSELAKRQLGYGRGKRMTIEQDHVEITSGVRKGRTLGSPITLVIENKDWKNWSSIMEIEENSQTNEEKYRLNKPRPGHADLVGGIKYHQKDLRNVLERSSARETAIRVAVGAIAKKLLKELGIELVGHVLVLGGIQAKRSEKLTIEQISEKLTDSTVRTIDQTAEIKMKNRIDQAKQNGDTLGGTIEVVVEGVPIGLGSYVHWDQKLDAKIAQALMSVNAFKAVEFGMGSQLAYHSGSQVMDEITWNELEGYVRKSNHLGGFEGGMTNGMPIIVRSTMKPLPTLYHPLQSVNIDTKESCSASVERSDCTAVPAASVICEAVVATEIAKALLDKFPNDSFAQMKKSVQNYREYTNKF